MKNLLKTLFLVIVVSIFCFSNNSGISKVRNFVTENGKALYQKGAIALSNSNVKFIASTGNFIK
jgi:outer membrane protein assembly factor BamD (BamD/ComL family)